MSNPVDRIFLDFYCRMRWHDGSNERQVALFNTMDYFCQHTLVSGDQFTGKSTTVVVGLSAFYRAQSKLAPGIYQTSKYALFSR